MSAHRKARRPSLEWFNSRRHAPLFRRPSVFLSASVVEPGREKEGLEPPGDPLMVREAVTAIAHQVLSRRWNLVFGGHPQVTPMLLALARQMAVSVSHGPTSRRAKRAALGDIICFQSALFLDQIPEATRSLWQFGAVLLVPKAGTGASTLSRSLASMRSTMLGVQRIVAAVYVGGMKGIFDEAALVRSSPSVAEFALPQTGSAAAHLFRSDPDRYSGRNPRLRELMQRARSQALVARHVAEQIAATLGS